jgi:hypothetical protein
MLVFIYVLFLDGLNYNKAFKDLIIALSKYSNKKVSLSSIQQEIFNIALTSLSKVSLTVKQSVMRSEFSILEKKTLILTTFLDLTVKVKSILGKFAASASSNSAEATANADKVLQLLSKFSKLVSDIGRYSFVYYLSTKLFC